MKLMCLRKSAHSLFLSLLMGFSVLSHGIPLIQNGHVIIDAETSWILRHFLGPIYKVAKIHEKPEIFLLVDPDINAFAVPGPAIFVHSGLLFSADTVGQLIGVMAHETGHIASSHISRRVIAYEDATQKGYWLGGLGLALGLLGGAPDAAMAAASGGLTAGHQSMLHFTRGQEASADEAAVKYLRQLQWNPTGLTSFFHKLKQQENLPQIAGIKYMVTHPLSGQRIALLTQVVTTSPFADKPYPWEFETYFKRLKAKTQAYILPINEVLVLYPPSDTSFPARYARSIAVYRQGKLSEALSLIDDLIHEKPADPFLYEFKAIVLLEKKDQAGALKAYEQALVYLPNEPLFHTGSVHVLLEGEAAPSAKNIETIRHHLAKIHMLDPSPFAWHLTAIFEGKLGNQGHSALALSEKHRLNGDYKEAKRQATRAKNLLKPSDQGYQRAQDILAIVDDEIKEQPKEESQRD